MDRPQKPIEVKVVLLGDQGVGKSSICSRFVSNEFDPNPEATIGAMFRPKQVYMDDLKKSVKFQIWDTAGQEKFRALAPMYYRDSRIAVIVYDITKKASFDCLKSWIDELKELGPPDIVMVIAANKSDLLEQEVVPETEARNFADDIGALFVSTSAKKNVGIEKLFIDAYKAMDPNKGNVQHGEKIPDKPVKKKKKGCC